MPQPSRRRATAFWTAGGLLLLVGGRADAGCGCDKPPPALAAVRPAFASPGNTVTLFDPALVDGVQYDVELTQGTDSSALQAIAVTRRDYADAAYKPQLVIAAPDLPLGPTEIVVRLGANTVLDVPSTDFTMLPRPVVIPSGNAVVKVPHYQAARGADGTLYLPLDVSAITARTVFAGVGKGGFRFLFDATEVAIYNVQGILMEQLATSTAPHEIDDGDDDASTAADEQGAASSRLIYDRHEFETYRRRHVTEATWLLDTDDLAWHADGTRHIDHDHLVIAIAGQLTSGSNGSGGGNGNGSGNLQAPSQNAFHPFTLKISTLQPDDPTAPSVSAQIAWDDTATTSTTVTATTATTVAATSTTTSLVASSTSTTLGGDTCSSTDPGVQLACLCEGQTLPACAADVVPRTVAAPLRAACRLLARSVEADGDMVSYLRGRAALQLQRARDGLGRGRARRLSAGCQDALTGALTFQVP